jgi:hypothetical protein
MKFLCLCYYDSAEFSALTPDRMQQMIDVCTPRDKELKASGRLDLVGSLGMPAETRTIRASESAVTVDAGPYAPTPQPIGAFFLIEAADMDEAVATARLHPSSHIGHILKGGVEVWPVGQLQRP